MEISQQPHQLPKCQGGKNLAPVHPGFNPIPFNFFPKTNHHQPVMNVPPFPFLSNYQHIESRCQETLLRSDVGDLRKGGRSTLRLSQVITLASVSRFPRRYLEPEPQVLFLF